MSVPVAPPSGQRGLKEMFLYDEKSAAISFDTKKQAEKFHQCISLGKMQTEFQRCFNEPSLKIASSLSDNYVVFRWNTGSEEVARSLFTALGKFFDQSKTTLSYKKLYTTDPNPRPDYGYNPNSLAPISCINLTHSSNEHRLTPDCGIPLEGRLISLQKKQNKSS